MEPYMIDPGYHRQWRGDHFPNAAPPRAGYRAILGVAIAMIVAMILSDVVLIGMSLHPRGSTTQSEAAHISERHR
jgi:hypothetical protein